MGRIHTYLALDLGAESGRAMLGTLADERLTLAEAHRFANIPVRLPDGLHWDVLRIWAEIKAGLHAAAATAGSPIEAIGLDTWGVDFALLDEQGGLLANPFHYRDSRTDGLYAEAFRRMSRADIYAQTGIQFMEVNTLYQLLAMVLAKSPLLEVARTFVTIPDLFNYWLTGRLICEFTNATTTQCFDPHRRDWARPLLAAMGVPESLFRPVTEPGTLVAPLHPGVAKESGASQVPVIAPACHDTGSAVAAVPAEGQNFAWISTGTWSILGTELDHPVISPQALQDNFTNEGGVFGTWRFSKNVMGLWIVQECRRAWARRGEDLSYDELTGLASSSQPFLAVIDPDDGGFLHPEDMPAQIREYCRRTGQVAPEEKGGLIRIVLESIALKYRWVLERLEEMTAMRFEQVHMIGGGTQNALLNQFTADATGRACLTGPVEATALGNMLLQAIALGHIASLADARRLIRLSFPPTTYTPAGSKKWDQAYHRLLSLLQARTH